MISKRSRRSTQPQEKLKQFAINSSNGVDGTKPVTDMNTILDMENLTVNDDGSVSLRNPLLKLYAAPSTIVGNPNILYTERHYISFSNRTPVFTIFTRDTFSRCSVTIKGYTYYARTEITISQEDFGALANLANATIINTSSSTIIGNCTINASVAAELGLIDSKLFVDSPEDPSEDPFENLSITLPRYLQLTETSTNVFELKIITPEMNTLTTSESDIKLNPNMTLDNPYAVRDTYGSEVVQVSGILPYVLPNSITWFEKINDSATVNSESVFIKDLNSVASLLEDGISDKDIVVADVSSNGGTFMSFTVAPNITVVLRIFSKNGQTYLKGTFSKDIYDGYLEGGISVGITFGILKYPINKTSNTTVEIFPTYNGDLYPDSPVASASLNLIVNPTEGDFEVPLYLEGAAYETGSYILSDKVSPNDAFEYWKEQKTSEIVGEFYRLCVVQASVNYTSNYSVRKGAIPNVTVPEVTENVRQDSYRAVSSVDVSQNANDVYLKAFCKFPKMSDFYCKWEYSLDGVSWNAYGDLHTQSDEIFVEVPDVNNSKMPSETHIVNKLPVATVTDYIASRPDILSLQAVKAQVPEDVDVLALVYRFRIFPILSKKTVDASHIKGSLGSDIAYFETRVPSGTGTEYLTTDMPNAVLGEKLYYKKAIYSYGTSEYDSFAYVSDTDSFITPLYNVLDLDVNAKDTVCAIIPWRNYLISCTEKAMYLSNRAESGFFTKAISTSVGVPYEDRHCAKAALNGIIFKSGHSVYFAYPNLYASDDTTLQLTDISKPISHILDEFTGVVESCFAEVVDDRYVLVLNVGDGVHSNVKAYILCYSLNTKKWEKYSYPMRFLSFAKHRVLGSTILGAVISISGTGISISGTGEYGLFEKDYSRVLPHRKLSTYGDVLDDTYSSNPTATPIEYYWDTGQKTDSILQTNQYVESKTVFATLDDRDAFPFTIYVAIDGDPHVVRQDVSTDAPFWKPEDGNSVGALSTAFKLANNDNAIYSAKNTLRQHIIRYSGKGKSIRHRIEGRSLYNFKMYETYVRYKILNIKQ